MRAFYPFPFSIFVLPVHFSSLQDVARGLVQAAPIIRPEHPTVPRKFSLQQRRSEIAIEGPCRLCGRCGGEGGGRSDAAGAIPPFPIAPVPDLFAGAPRAGRRLQPDGGRAPNGIKIVRAPS